MALAGSSDAQPSHALWDSLLSAYVDNAGMVDYNRMRADQTALDRYLETLQETVPSSDWRDEDQMAYWINAYNAFTVKLVLQSRPKESIREYNDGNPWAIKWIKIGGELLSLDDIEHRRLRGAFKEPAIHFALNCASRSCPPLAQKAFTGNTLRTMLDNQSKAFINNPRYNTIRPERIQLSKIFEWYAEDFGDVRAYINSRVTEHKISGETEIEFLDYDWSLNRQ